MPPCLRIAQAALGSGHAAALDPTAWLSEDLFSAFLISDKLSHLSSLTVALTVMLGVLEWDGQAYRSRAIARSVLADRSGRWAKLAQSASSKASASEGDALSSMDNMFIPAGRRSIDGSLDAGDFGEGEGRDFLVDVVGSSVDILASIDTADDFEWCGAVLHLWRPRQLRACRLVTPTANIALRGTPAHALWTQRSILEALAA